MKLKACATTDCEPSQYSARSTDTLSRAMSFDGSVPITRALSGLSFSNFTVTCEAPAITW